MNMMILLMAFGAACIIFLLVMGITSLAQSGRDKVDQRVKGRLKALAMTNATDEKIDLVIRDVSMSEVPWFNRFLEKMQLASMITRLIKQADTKGSAGVYLLLCALLAFVGMYAGYFVSNRLWVSILIGWGLGYLPIMRLKRLKAKRMDRFQQQLPEALDLMGRALKAGHTFGGGMRMVADEFDDPISSEFRQTIGEINYGMDVGRALNGLLNRVDCLDLKFFVVSVNIQRETGGNLAEIITKIASLVRERFVLFGKVKILSAEGRLSAKILVALPFLITGILYIVNPDYISLLWTREMGKGLIWVSITSMTVGVLIIRRIVQIKV
ncbi:MAG: type II secretion system F family protein [Pseudodesulfovibrio sp.]|nr:type II secretion system F family protein [Pseudodesulfovibrio sp.]